ncbi:tetratricopeptide repeat protein [Marinobacter sp. ATCH36]|uniref:tetratricopeptide repeat protein n=1 Tax=Marinobacter sp. ATCH36 TaxID=2945106 RepID=UPI002020317C|nr:tetratricopeptide repeat protein [Marinobacter sp. ATCH36]MCL7942554.1 tetratricopeptide repeat protein [Marinobacter sp. ATCH36]
MLSTSATAALKPIETDFDDNRIFIELPEPALSAPALPDSPEKLADIIQSQIVQSRNTGDPRFLGYAEGLFQQWPGEMTARLQVLRATMKQSLHQFDAARQDLDTVIADSDDPQQRNQARLLLANLELVQGNYKQAREHCTRLQETYPGLVSASCVAQVKARTGNAPDAYNTLREQVRSANTRDVTGRLWAEGTLGDIAAQLGKDETTDHWVAVLGVTPDDLYTRSQLADWHLEHGNKARVLELTEGYESVDSLAVIRAIALKRSGAPQADTLISDLRERFAEARWRGTLLHQRDVARFQLDIEENPADALENAVNNWSDQREPLDTRLVLRASSAAGDQQQQQEIREWLEQQRQTDARYPEAGS